MVSLDEVFGLLSKERRRYALYYLEQAEGPVSVEEVAEHVAEWETNGVSAIPEDKFERIEVDLHHTDLPKTAEVELIEYDSATGVVKGTQTNPKTDAIISVAKVIERPERNP